MQDYTYIGPGKESGGEGLFVHSEFRFLLESDTSMIHTKPNLVPNIQSMRLPDPTRT